MPLDRVLPVRDLDRLTFGTMKVAGEFDGLVMRPRPYKQVRQIIERSYALGFRSFDTAPLYGLGASESAIGDVLCGTDIAVSTKIGIDLHSAAFPFPSYAKESIVVGLEASLRRLKDLRIVMVYLHNPPDDVIHNEDFIFWAKGFVGSQVGPRCGLGVSVASMQQVKDRRSLQSFDAVMVSYGDFRRYSLNGRIAGVGVPLVVRELFNGGSVFKNRKMRPLIRRKLVSTIVGKVLAANVSSLIVAPRTVGQMVDYIG